MIKWIIFSILLATATGQMAENEKLMHQKSGENFKHSPRSDTSHRIISSFQSITSSTRVGAIPTFYTQIVWHSSEPIQIQIVDSELPFPTLYVLDKEHLMIEPLSDSTQIYSNNYGKAIVAIELNNLNDLQRILAGHYTVLFGIETAILGATFLDSMTKSKLIEGCPPNANTLHCVLGKYPNLDSLLEAVDPKMDPSSLGYYRAYFHATLSDSFQKVPSAVTHPFEAISNDVFAEAIRADGESFMKNKLSTLDYPIHYMIDCLQANMDNFLFTVDGNKLNRLLEELIMNLNESASLYGNFENLKNKLTDSPMLISNLKSDLTSIVNFHKLIQIEPLDPKEQAKLSKLLVDLYWLIMCSPIIKNPFTTFLGEVFPGNEKINFIVLDIFIVPFLIQYMKEEQWSRKETGFDSGLTRRLMKRGDELYESMAWKMATKSRLKKDEVTTPYKPGFFDFELKIEGEVRGRTIIIHLIYIFLYYYMMGMFLVDYPFKSRPLFAMVSRWADKMAKIERESRLAQWSVLENDRFAKEEEAKLVEQAEIRSDPNHIAHVVMKERSWAGYIEFYRKAMKYEKHQELLKAQAKGQDSDQNLKFEEEFSSKYSIENQVNTIKKEHLSGSFADKMDIPKKSDLQIKKDDLISRVITTSLNDKAPSGAKEELAFPENAKSSSTKKNGLFV